MTSICHLGSFSQLQPGSRAKKSNRVGLGDSGHKYGTKKNVFLLFLLLFCLAGASRNARNVHGNLRKIHPKWGGAEGSALLFFDLLTVFLYFAEPSLAKSVRHRASAQGVCSQSFVQCLFLNSLKGTPPRSRPLFSGLRIPLGHVFWHSLF